MTNSVGAGEIRLTREELYERVWAEPMATLAPQFGISDVALKKTCTKLRVPTPYRGYWARKSAGAAARRTPLPKLPASVNPATMTATFRLPSTPTAEEEEGAQAGPVAEQARYEALPEHRITVPEVLADPHPLVAASVVALRKAKADAQRRLVVPPGRRCLAVSVTPDTVDRAMAIYDALIKALEARGYPVEVAAATTGGDQHSTSGTAAGTVVHVGDQRVGILIEERIERRERAPEPRARKEPPPTFYLKEYDYVPTGRLTLRILESYLQLKRRSWSDGARQRLEESLNDAVVGIIAAAEALGELQRAREAREREWAAAEERRQLAERRRQEEASRVRALDASVAAWRRAAVIREYVRAMRASAEAAGALAAGAPLAEWLAWAEAYAERMDPTRAAVPAVPSDPEPHRWYGSYGGDGAGGGRTPNDSGRLW